MKLLIIGRRVIAHGDIQDHENGFTLGDNQYQTASGFECVEVASIPDDFVPQAWLYEGGELVANPAYAPPVEVVPVPAQVTMRQARLALHQAGLLAGVDAAIATLDEPAKTATRIEWEYAQTVDRASGLVPEMATALGMTETQVDDLFRLAATL